MPSSEPIDGSLIADSLEAAPASSAPETAPQTAAPGASPTRGAVLSVTPALAARCYLSLIIPAYNEEKRLPDTLTRIAEYMALRDFSYELVVVDDGSRDKTRQVVTNFAATHPWVRLAFYNDEAGRPLNRGKGYAVRHGIASAVGRDILFSDADLSTPIEEMEKLLPPISRGDCDIAIASRALPESNLTVHQPWYRERMGRIFNSIVRRIIDTPFADTQCGFKAFRGVAAKKIFGMARVDGFGFDTEILFLAAKLKLRVQELPVTWNHRDDSRVNPLIAPFQMIQEVIQVRLNDIRGCYEDTELHNSPQ